MKIEREINLGVPIQKDNIFVGRSEIKVRYYENGMLDIFDDKNCVRLVKGQMRIWLEGINEG